MGTTFTIYSFLALSGCILAGLFFAWLLYSRPSGLTKSIRIALALFRMIAVTLILWLLFSPLISRVNYSFEKPVVIIAQDNSQSVGHLLPAGFDSLRYRKSLEQLAKDLAEKYDVRTYSFSDRVTTGLNFDYKGKFTNASLLFEQLNDQLMNKNVGTVILATDGIFNRGGNPSAQLAGLRAPVNIIALGDTIPKKDVLIAAVNSSDLVYLDNDFNLEVDILAYQLGAAQTTLRVIEDNKILYEEKVRLHGTSFSKTISVPLKASKLGHHNYTVSLSKTGNEVSLENNTQHIVIEVIDDRQKVLIAAAGPHPDIAALKSAIALNKHYDVSVILNEGLSAVNPEAYGLIILYQLPGTDAYSHGVLTKIQAGKTPLWYIIGAQSNIGSLNKIQQDIVLSGSNSLQHVYSDFNTNLTAFNPDGKSVKTVERFDPLQSPVARLNIQAPEETVIYQRISKSKTNTPQLFFINTNSRKTGYLIGEGLWRWKLSEAKEDPATPVFNRLISNVAQYLSVKDDKRKFAIHPERVPFEENEAVIFSATLYNDSYVPVNKPEVSIRFKNAQGKEYNFSFSKFKMAYRLDAGILPAGDYRYTASTRLGEHQYTASGTFFINPVVAEFGQTIADHQLLTHLAAETHGKVYMPDQLMKLKEALYSSEQLKTLSYEDRKYEELINMKWIFFLILLLLSTEWLIRKRNAAL